MLARLATRQITRFSSAWSLGALNHVAIEPKIGAHGKPVVFLHPADCNGVLTELEEA